MLARLQAGWKPDWKTIQQIWSRARSLNHGIIGPSGITTVEHLLVEMLCDDLYVSNDQLLIVATPADPMLSRIAF